MLSLKFFYKDEIHKSAAAPKDYKSLIETIKILYTNHINSAFELQYEDIDEDKIMLANQVDYETMLKTQNRGQNSIKIYITDKGNTQLFQLREYDDDYHAKVHLLLQAENYQVINNYINSTSKSDEPEIIISKPEECFIDSSSYIKEIDIKDQNHEFTKIENTNDEVNSTEPIKCVRVLQVGQNTPQSNQKIEAQIKNSKQSPIQTDIQNMGEKSNNLRGQCESSRKSSSSPIQNIAGSSGAINVPEAKSEKIDERCSYQVDKALENKQENFKNKRYDCEFMSGNKNTPDIITMNEKNFSKVVKIKNTGSIGFPSGTYLREFDKQSAQKLRVPRIEVNNEHELTLKMPMSKNLGKHTSKWVLGFLNEHGTEELIGKPYEFTYEIVRNLPTDLSSRAKILQELFPGKPFNKYYKFVKYSKCVTMDELISNFVQKFP